MVATLSETFRKPATIVTISCGIFVLVIFLTLLFEALSATGRLVVATMAIGGALALFLADGWSFFRFRLSASTAAMVIGFVGIAAGTGLGTFMFLGLALVAASLGLVLALVQFVRFRSLQFILETAASLLVIKFVYFAGSQI